MFRNSIFIGGPTWTYTASNPASSLYSGDFNAAIIDSVVALAKQTNVVIVVGAYTPRDNPASSLESFIFPHLTPENHSRSLPICLFQSMRRNCWPTRFVWRQPSLQWHHYLLRRLIFVGFPGFAYRDSLRFADGPTLAAGLVNGLPGLA